MNISDLLEEAKTELELTPSSSQSPKQDTAEPAPPVLDLGNTEIILDLAEDLEPVSLGPSSPPAPAESDEFELKLEIDDSDDEIPEVEIEGLGLELEDSDSPSNPEKP